MADRAGTPFYKPLAPGFGRGHSPSRASGYVWRPRPLGQRELEILIERGLVAGAEVVADRARANIHPYRYTGAIEDSIHVVEDHVGAWPKPAVFVSTASGDGYYVEMGTVKTPARLYLSQALDSTIMEFPSLMKYAARRR